MYLKKRLFGAMGNSTRAKPKTTKEGQALKKAIKQTMSFSLGTRKAIGEVGIDKRTENTAEPLDYPVLERGHDGAGRAQTWPSLNVLGRLEIALFADELNEEKYEPVSFFLSDVGGQLLFAAGR